MRSVRPPHPLFGAELRAKRAAVQIGSLRRHLARWTEIGREHVRFEYDDAGELVTWNVTEDLPIAEVLGRTGVWVGEALFNLRAALDYLIYEIACTCNGGRHVSNTQFPICNEWDDFVAQATGKHPRTKKRVTCRLKHVPPLVVNRLAQLQPCSSPPCEWTGLLRDLSNPQKHHGIGSFSTEFVYLPSTHPELVGRVEQDEEGTQTYYFTGQVFFSKPRLDIIDTLQMLQREVRSLIEEFKPAFKRTP